MKRIVQLLVLVCLLGQATTSTAQHALAPLEVHDWQARQLMLSQSSPLLQSDPLPLAQGNQSMLPTWDQLPLHKHALAQARMTRNGDGAIWRTRLERPKSQGSVDIMDTRNFTLFDYRKMFAEARTPQPWELTGRWRGVNKGIVELVGYRQFIKEIVPTPCDLRGDNIQVEQVSNELLRTMGWSPIAGMPEEGYVSRLGYFQVQQPRGKGTFRHGAIFSYRDGQGNRKTDACRLLVDKVVVLDRNHLLGRATANFGPLQIPLAYFTLERVRE